ncbi:hypothetical protein [Flavobacterium capsici]|uniref:Uncharacterized protein n=1 Tax=Flavobacterium capsici TaxID=3075618 RepID=A0AA96EVR7_9FLAO|nr:MULTISPECIES: hypothetical protein [unclassified Flavobacterium]WNM19489.1 hypothetical protein RN608_02120 [Flavobacterium sp. PMR2A8]WNM20878.1 hypothetical protein RN605_09290 [Flavobacterium sp. PMTSA4]
MKYKVLYIDDETSQNSQAFADGLSSQNLIEIAIKLPTKFEELINELIAEQKDIDALILDLKLDGNQQGDRTATYTAPSLATGIRTKCFAENGFENEFPIFLISSTNNLKKYYDSDTSSHDLFDYTFYKTSIAQKGKEYELLITSITHAYKAIQENKTNFNTLLGLPADSEIPNKVFTTKFLLGDGTSISEISQYIFNEIISKSGVLIDETILAARLGINFNESSDWLSLIENLNDYKYSGIFKDSFNRWWSHDILNWWNSNFPKPLIQLTALDRVNLLKEKFKLDNLVKAQQIHKTTSTKFWTVCQAYKLPLDPKDGFLLDGNLMHPWQDKRYLSLHSILERDAKELGLFIHPAEKERLEDIKQVYK